MAHALEEETAMIVVNTETIPGYKVERVLGMVQGNVVRAKHVGRDIAAGLKNLVGGELKGYTELLVESRREAIRRMLAQAEQLGANAVINVRFSTSAITQGAAELYAYGTAVIVVAEAGTLPAAVKVAETSSEHLVGDTFASPTQAPS
jgi:uncharacterized protein YbjQ (UPF0145 family)